MHNLQRGIRSMLLLALAVLLGSSTSPPAQARQHSSACTQVAEAPGPQDRSQAGPTGELSLDQNKPLRACCAASSALVTISSRWL